MRRYWTSAASLAASSWILRILLSHLSGSVDWMGITIPKVHERVQLAKRQFRFRLVRRGPLGWVEGSAFKEAALAVWREA